MSIIASTHTTKTYKSNVGETFSRKSDSRSPFIVSRVIDTVYIMYTMTEV